MSSVGSDDPCDDEFQDYGYEDNESYYDENYGEDEDYESYGEECEYEGFMLLTITLKMMTL